MTSTFSKIFPKSRGANAPLRTRMVVDHTVAHG